MNRFITTNNSFQNKVAQIVENEFVSVTMGQLMGSNLDSFVTKSPFRVAGSNSIVETSEPGNSGNKRKMVWSVSRWGGNNSVI